MQKREDGELSSSQSSAQEQEAIARAKMNNSVADRQGPRDSEATVHDQRVAQVIHQDGNAVDVVNQQDEQDEDTPKSEQSSEGRKQ